MRQSQQPNGRKWSPAGPSSRHRSPSNTKDPPPAFNMLRKYSGLHFPHSIGKYPRTRWPCNIRTSALHPGTLPNSHTSPCRHTLLQSSLLALREALHLLSPGRWVYYAAAWSEPPSSLLVLGLFMNSPCGTGVTAISALL